MFLTWLACHQGTMSPPLVTSHTAGDTGGTAARHSGDPVAEPPYRPTWIRAWDLAPDVLVPSGDGRLLALIGGWRLSEAHFGIGDADAVTWLTDSSAFVAVVDPATGLPVEWHRIADGRWRQGFVGAPDPGGMVVGFRGDDQMVPFPDDGGTVVPSWDVNVVARLDPSGRPRWFSYLLGGQVTWLAAGPDGSVFACGHHIDREIELGTFVADAGSGSSFVAAWAPDGEPRWLLVSGQTGACWGLAADDVHLWVGWSGTSRPNGRPTVDHAELLALDAGTGAFRSAKATGVSAVAVGMGGVDVLTFDSDVVWLRHAEVDRRLTAGFEAFAPYLDDTRLVPRPDGWMLWGRARETGALGAAPSMEAYASEATDLVVGMVARDGRAVAALDAGTTSVDDIAGVVELADGGIVAGARGIGYVGAQRTSPDALGHGGGGTGWLVRWDPVH
ncbi:MAG: hypothetical protein H6738_03110 [Alphaproteobacteria bacterium]|nr:hypothetical protein [Alphaproteobacteria bacterium]MCB9695759.1 hypothetical protein [Alphaproteobacteria bacterium]